MKPNDCPELSGEGNIGQPNTVNNMSLSLRDSIARYIQEILPEQVELDIEGLQNEVRTRVSTLNKGDALVYALMGLPGVGKSANINFLKTAAQEALDIKTPKEFVVYKYPDGTVLKNGGYIGDGGKKAVLTINLDYFFRAIGADRRELMLESIWAFKRLWGDSRALLNFVLDVFSQRKTDTNIYTGSPDERSEKKSSGTIEIKNHVERGSTVVAILEGVNAGWVTGIIEKIGFLRNVNTEKVLFNVSLEESLIRVLRRDHDSKNQSFEYILQNRITEYERIVRVFILPALKDPNTVLLTKDRDLPPFTEAERSEIFGLLIDIQERYSENQISPENAGFSEMKQRDQEKQRKFIFDFSSHLMDYFQKVPLLTPEELELWKKIKLLRKEKKKLEEAKKVGTFYEDLINGLSLGIKRIKKEIKKIKKRIGLGGKK